MAIEIRDLVLVRSAGERFRHPFSSSIEVRAELKVQRHGSGHEAHWTVETTVTVIDPETEAKQYRGESAFAVFPAQEAVVDPPELYALMWPHLRADLLAQCSRIAGQQLSLPVVLTPEDLPTAADVTDRR